MVYRQIRHKFGLAKSSLSKTNPGLNLPKLKCFSSNKSVNNYYTWPLNSSGLSGYLIKKINWFTTYIRNFFKTMLLKFKAINFYKHDNDFNRPQERKLIKF